MLSGEIYCNSKIKIVVVYGVIVEIIMLFILLGERGFFFRYWWRFVEDGERFFFLFYEINFIFESVKYNRVIIGFFFLL